MLAKGRVAVAVSGWACRGAGKCREACGEGEGEWVCRGGGAEFELGRWW